LSHFFSLNLAFLIIYKILRLPGTWGSVIYMILSIILCLFAGSLIHVLIEKRILYILRNMGKRRVKRNVMSQVDTDVV